MIENLITFQEDEHLYKYKDTKLSSATTILKPYFPFDVEDQLYRSAYKLIFGEKEWNKIIAKTFKYDYKVDLELMHSKLEPLIDWENLLAAREFLREEWRMSGVKGTECHLIEENKLYDAGEFYNHRTDRTIPVIQLPKSPLFDNQSVGTDYFNQLEDGCYPELLVHSGWDAMKYVDNEGNITSQKKYDRIMKKCNPGQSDIVCVETIDGIRYVDVYDHKFTKREPKKRYGEANRAAPPLNKYKVRNDKINKFELQLSFYMHCLVKVGFTPRHMDFFYYKDYDHNDKKIFKLKYQPEIVDVVLKDYSKKLKEK